MLKDEDSPDPASIANAANPAAPPPSSSPSPPNSVSSSARVIINSARAWAGPDDISLLDALIVMDDEDEVTEDEDVVDTDPCVSVAGATGAVCVDGIMPVG